MVCGEYDPARHLHVLVTPRGHLDRSGIVAHRVPVGVGLGEYVRPNQAPVLVGGLAMGKHLVPGTPLGGEHTPAEIRQIAPSLR